MAATLGGSAEPDANRRMRTIEPRIVEPRGDDIFRARPRQTFRNEIADQKPHERGIAVGEMKRVGAPIGITGGGVTHMRRRTGLELEPAKARKVEGPDIERGHRIGPDAPLAMRTRLID